MKENNKQERIITIILAVILVFTVFVAPVSAADLHVGTGQTYSAIQDAIDTASPHDTIIVHDGTYTENVDVNVAHLTIQSENGSAVTIVHAVNSDDDVVGVTENYLNISGFTVTGATGSCGIYLKSGTNYCNISENNCSNNQRGIFLSDSSNNTIKNNIANSNNWEGICLYSSSNNTITGNIANLNKRYGIFLYHSSNNMLTGNTANSNQDYGIFLSDSSNNRLTVNTANSNQQHGIRLYSYSYEYSSSNYNTLAGNTANSNDYIGISLSSSSHNMLVNNTANSNNNGISISYLSSKNNTIYHNNLADNTQNNAYDTYHSTNTWDNGMEGNYYSDYTSTDLDGDGIGDTAHSIPGSEVKTDNYPLMQSWKGYQVHNLNTNEDFLGIQAAIDDSDTDDGHTIIVDAGVYKMNIDINKQLTLQGASADVVTVIASQLSDHIFDVTADRVNISGFTVTGAGSGKGIHLNGTDYCSISNNIASNNEYGIFLNSSRSNTLANNAMSGNINNFVVRGVSLSEYTHSVDTSNTIDEKPIYYWVGQQDKSIPGDAGYVGVVNSINITVRNLTLTKNGEGVLFAYTEQSMIENVTVNWNDYGIYLYSSSNNTLINTNASSNEDYGIYMHNSNNNMLTKNIVNSNDCGIYLYSSTSNTFANTNTSSNEDYGISLLNSDNNKLQDNTANSNNYYGITIHFSNDNMLHNNSASNNTYGIYLYSSINNILSGNTIYLNNRSGIKLNESSNNTLASNTADSNRDYGIDVSFSSSNKIIGNTMRLNDCGIYMSFSSSNTITNNNASSNVDYGIYLYHSGNNKLTKNTVNRNNGDTGYYGNGTCDWNHWYGGDGGNGYGYGICLSYSNYNTLTENFANSNGGKGGDGGSCRCGGNGGDGYGYGIYLYSSSNNTLMKNTANSNGGRGGDGGTGYDIIGGDGGNGYGYGISLNFSSNNTVIENIVKSNNGSGGKCGRCLDINCDNGDVGEGYGYGINLPSSRNTLYHNNLINNTNYNAYDTGTNQWDSETVGNYYSDYTGTDSNGDGIGDTPYPIPGGSNEDKYPLMSPYMTDVKPPFSISNLHSFPGSTWVKWTWTNPSDPDFSYTEIYLNSIHQTSTSSNFFNATPLTPNTEYTISTRTVDTSGNINTTWVNNTATTQSPSKININLHTGWNLISVPLNLITWELGDESIVGDPLNVTPKHSLISIYRYNSTSGSFEKCDYFDNWGWSPATGSENFTELEPGRGYWVMANQDCILTFDGTSPFDLNISINKDWNLVGWYSMSEALLGEEAIVGNPLNVIPENSLVSIYRYNTTIGLFEKCDHFPDWGWGPATGSEEFTKLDPGRGYWVMAANDCKWQYRI